MKHKRLIPAIAAGAAFVMVLSACGGSDDGNGDGSGGGDNKTPAFNAGVGKVFNQSDAKGGIIKMADNGEPDSLDPADTYYGYMWDFARLYGRSLVMFKPAPGKASEELVPDLAEDLGEASDEGKTWTYKIRKGIKYEDGTEVKAADVKYGVLRTLDREAFPNGPEYFKQFLNLPEGYAGPYKSKGVDTSSAIETPDDYTVVFHLKTPFAGFDYLAMLPQTFPVPEAKDTGVNYRDHVISSGPYKFDKVEQGKQFTLVRNDQWDAKSDPNRPALPDGYEVTLNLAQSEIDNQLMSGDLHVHVTGTGVGSAAQSQVLADETSKENADNPTISRLWYTSINSNVAPFDNKDCRIAIEYATDRTSYQRAMGGELAGGDIATNLLPPAIPGYKKFDLYPAGQDNKGDLEKAKDHLKKCGKPDGFDMNIAYRNERDAEKAVAESLQQSLKRVGINLTLKGYAQGDYFSQFVGLPSFAKSNGLGLVVNGWGADWNDGFGYLSQIVDSRVIRETGGSSNVSVRDPKVDQMLDEAVAELDDAKREKLWSDIDRQVMDDAFILPGVVAKVLLYRGKGLTNVYVNEQFGYYDYVSLGLEQ